jgi:hypothetical protein
MEDIRVKAFAVNSRFNTLPRFSVTSNPLPRKAVKRLFSYCKGKTCAAGFIGGIGLITEM